MPKVRIRAFDMDGHEIATSFIINVDIAGNVMSPNSEFVKAAAHMVELTVIDKIMHWSQNHFAGEIARWMIVRSAKETEEREEACND